MAAKIKFEFSESNLFRVIHADGLFGGPTPKGDLYASFFNERNAIPVSVSHAIDGSRLGDEIMEERVAADAVQRTFEVAVVMNLDTAIVVRDWFSRNIDVLQSLQGKKEVEAAKQ